MQLKSLVLLALTLAAGTVNAQKNKKNKKNKVVNAHKQLVKQPQAKAVDGKVFSYAFGVLQGRGLRQYITERENVDTTKLNDFVRGLNADPKSDEAKRAIAYAAGLKIATMNEKMKENINKEVNINQNTNYFNVSEFNKALEEILLKKPTSITPDSAKKIVEEQSRYSQEIYLAKNKEFLAENRKKPGVKTTKSGLQYTVLVEGKGELPSDTSTVEVNYEGKLINGKVFDSSYQRGETAKFPVYQVIKGWTEALKMMPEGSTWEIVIPAELGYGARNLPQIPANSTLIFKVQLLKSNVKKTSK